MERTMPERLVAEFVGTFTLIFIGAGAVVLFNAIPGAMPVGIIGIAIAHGLAIGVMVSSVGHVSGAHFNPAVTIGAWITQKVKSMDAIAYIVIQAAGAVAAAGVLRLALPKGILKSAGDGSPFYGTPTVIKGISNGQGVLIEAVLTFFLVWVIFATAVDPEGAFNKIAGLAIGFTITMDILMGGFATGAAMNPARWFGPALLSGHWTGGWVYLVGPVAGAVVAAALYDGLIIKRPGAAAAHEQPHGVGAHGEDVPPEM